MATPKTDSACSHVLMVFVVFLVVHGVLGAERELVVPNLGTVSGTVIDFLEDRFINVETQVDAFLGIPYAENPPERFSQATPVRPWDGVWNATYYRPACSQLGNEVEVSSEDCLYLNVFVRYPRPVDPAPVMFWIHGGGLTTGTGSTYGRSGVPLVAVGQDVIVVTINYRLNVFNVFTTGDDVATGNLALLDQQLALQWVHDNIAAFGGDPNRVTLFGVSAGAMSVDFHLLSAGSRDLFSQAIMESGTTRAPGAFRDDPEADRQEALALGTRVGCEYTDSQELVDCLKTIDAESLMNAFFEVYPGTILRIDGVFLTEDPAIMYASGSFKKCPVMAGYNKDEGTIFAWNVFPDDDGDVAPFMSRAVYDESLPNTLYGNNDDIVVKAVDQQYVDWTRADNSSADYLAAFVGANGDQRFSCPSDYVIRAHAQAGDTVFQYFMTHDPSVSFFESGVDADGPGWLGATHTEDVQFVWGWPFIPEWMANRKALQDEEIALSVKVMTMWTNFAKYSHPGKMSADSEPATEGDYYWPQYTIPELEYKEISLGLPTGRAVRASECAFWNQYWPDLVQVVETTPPDEREWRQEFNGWKSEMEEWRTAFEEYQENRQC